MATGKLGMNPDEVDALAKSLDATAGEITQLMNRVTSQLQSTTWEGPDRNSFESTWRSDSCRQLGLIDSLLRETAGKARANAADQRSTSSRV